MEITVPQEFIDRMMHLASQSASWEDPDFEVYAYSGGNVDDAFALGQRDGEIEMAREFRSMFGIRR